MRWTRGGAIDESARTRPAKSCGPDAPTLALSGDNACALRLRWWQKSPVTKESPKETVKTIAQGMPGDSGVTVVTMLVCFLHFAREAAGASGTRRSLRPLIFRGTAFISNLGAIAPESANACLNWRRHCEERSDEAIQTVTAAGLWIASLCSQ